MNLIDRVKFLAEVRTSDLIILYGNRDLRQTRSVNVTEIIRHPNYSSFNNDRDMALLRAATPFVFDEFAQPTKLLYHLGEFQEGDELLATGYGVTTVGGTSPSYTLQEVLLLYVPRDNCEDAYKKAGILCILFNYEDIGDDKYCAAALGKDSKNFV